MPAIAEVAAAIAQSLLDPFRRDLAQALDRARREGLAHEPPQPLVIDHFGVAIRGAQRVDPDALLAKSTAAVLVRPMTPCLLAA